MLSSCISFIVYMSVLHMNILAIFFNFLPASANSTYSFYSILSWMCIVLSSQIANGKLNKMPYKTLSTTFNRILIESWRYSSISPIQPIASIQRSYSGTHTRYTLLLSSSSQYVSYPLPLLLFHSARILNVCIARRFLYSQFGECTGTDWNSSHCQRIEHCQTKWTSKLCLHFRTQTPMITILLYQQNICSL